MRKFIIFTLLLIAGSALFFFNNHAHSIISPTATIDHPNILLLISDDQRWDEISPTLMPQVYEQIFSKGITFRNAHATTPSCCPSRASIMTGRYTSRHKVLSNSHILTQETVMERLRPYFYTGYVGKYLNGSSGEPRPEFDYWASFTGGSSRYNNPVLFENGPQPKVVRGYITELLGDHGLQFLTKWKSQTKPFFLTMSFNAPHYPHTPLPEDLTAVSEQDIPFLTSKSFLPTLETLTAWGKPPHLLQDWKQKTPNDVKSMELRRLATLRSLDRAIGKTITQLEQVGALKNTLIIFLSDNGMQMGEQGRVGKNYPYESSLKIPFAVRYDNKISTPREDYSSLVTTLDIAPTISETVGMSLENPDGMSLAPLFAGLAEKPFRTDFLIEYFSLPHDLKEAPYQFSGVHTGNHVYLEYVGVGLDPSRVELYDLKRDPFQTVNLSTDPHYAEMKSNLKQRLSALLSSIRGSDLYDIPGAETIPEGVERRWARKRLLLIRSFKRANRKKRNELKVK